MHIFGKSDPIAMASAIHDALALTQTPVNALIFAQPMNNSLDTAMLNATIGAKGKYSGGVYQFGIPRNEKIMDAGMEIPSSMGVATGINFQPLGNGNVAITGDFVLTDDKVNPVIKTLRDNNINVDADIMKVGHHGSRTASGAPFISAVSPDISVIEFSAGNDYGHPHQNTLDRLHQVSKVYRTDLDSTITVTTDGSSYSVSTEN